MPETPGWHISRNGDQVVIDTNPGAPGNEPRYSPETALFMVKEILRAVSGILSERSGVDMGFEVVGRLRV